MEKNTQPIGAARFAGLTWRVFFLAIALSVIAVVVAGVLYDAFGRHALLGDRRAEMVGRFRLGESRIRQAVDTLRRDTAFLAGMPPISGIQRAVLNGGLDARDGNDIETWRRRLQDIFATFIVNKPDYYQIRYIGVASDGRELVRVDLGEGNSVTVISGNRLQSKADRDYFQQVRKAKSDEAGISGPALNQENGHVEKPYRPTFRASKPVFNADGSLFGMVVVNMDIRGVLAEFAQTLPLGLEAYLASGRGDFMFHAESGSAPDVRVDDPMPWWEEIRRDVTAQGNKEPVARKVMTPDGVRHVVAGYMQFADDTPEHSMLLGFALDEKELQDDVVAMRLRIVLGSGLAISMAAILIAFVLRRVFAPLRGLTSAAAAIAQGQYDTSVPENLDSEIGALGHALREMQERVAVRESELVRLNSDLEARVAARTADLQLAATLFANTAESVMVADAENTILSINPAFSEITGYAESEAVGRKTNLLRSDHHDPSFYQALWESIERAGQWCGEIWNRRKDGEAFLALLTINRVLDEVGRVYRYVAVFRDVTDLRRKDERIRHLAYHDALTGLPNRLLMIDRLTYGIALARREDRRTGLMFIDLDRFKTINDSLGHDVGDRLLEEVARRLSGCIRDSDTVARMGGDEFVILLPNSGTPVDSAALAEKLIARLSEPIRIDEHQIQIGASVGIALFPEDGDTPGDLMKHADAAMYAAKESGRGAFRFYKSAMSEQAGRYLKLEMELRQAVARDELVLHYQPKLCLESGRVHGFEALVRWNHPARGLLAPTEFIDMAEECGLITEIGEWVLAESCRQAAIWQAEGFREFRIAVNLSARQLQDGGLADRINVLALENGIPPSMLEVELTESEVMANPEQASRVFDQLHELGVTVAVDDFGTGYSSLAYLRRLPIDVLKIDRSFVSDADRDEDDAQIVQTIIALGRALRLVMVAEGVETTGQADLLRASGCHLVQGYLHARPLPAAELRPWLEKLADACA